MDFFNQATGHILNVLCVAGTASKEFKDDRKI